MGTPRTISTAFNVAMLKAAAVKEKEKGSAPSDGMTPRAGEISNSLSTTELRGSRWVLDKESSKVSMGGNSERPVPRRL